MIAKRPNLFGDRAQNTNTRSNKSGIFSSTITKQVWSYICNSIYINNYFLIKSIFILQLTNICYRRNIQLID